MIQEKVDKQLLLEEAKKSTRIRSGMWSPSSFGKCYRAQYWNRLNEPKTSPIDAETLRRFKVGNLIHQFFQDILKEDHFVEVMVKTDCCLGYADLVGVDEVIDIKSIRAYQYKLMRDKRKKYDFKREKKENILQVCFYAKGLGKPKGRLIFVDKDSMGAIEFGFDVAEFEKELQSEIDRLNEFWSLKQLPPAEPRCFNGKECQYCSWSVLDKCKEK